MRKEDAKGQHYTRNPIEAAAAAEPLDEAVLEGTGQATTTAR